jgi:hypothetical protein
MSVNEKYFDRTLMWVRNGLSSRYDGKMLFLKHLRGNNQNSFVAWTILVSKLGFPGRAIIIVTRLPSSS